MGSPSVSCFFSAPILRTLFIVLFDLFDQTRWWGGIRGSCRVELEGRARSELSGGGYKCCGLHYMVILMCYLKMLKGKLYFAFETFWFLNIHFNMYKI
jgi:hypothetical protein